MCENDSFVALAAHLKKVRGISSPESAGIGPPGSRLAQAEPVAAGAVSGPGIPGDWRRHTVGMPGHLHTGDARAVQDLLGRADARMTARRAHVVDMAQRNPALFVPGKAGCWRPVLRVVSCGKLGLTRMRKAGIDNFNPPAADHPVLAEVVRRLIEVYHPLRIYLFGSAARGDAGPDSDHDLMVVVADDTPRPLRDSGRAYKAIWRLGVASDVLVWTLRDSEDRLHLKASLPATVLREGKLLYAA